jgi:hypothetical protein
MARRETLDLVIGVRIPAPQPLLRNSSCHRVSIISKNSKEVG